MGIYIGDVGSIELTRKSLEGGMASVVNPSDVNASRSRFSFDFDEGYLTNGDFIEISTTDGTTLDFVNASGWDIGAVQTSGNWYVFIDEVGGVKLYNTFANSLNGGATGRIPLVAIARNIPILVTIRNRGSRLIASITDYVLNTNRETVDITALSDQYRQQYSSLISGSGSITALWDYVNNAGKEPIHYLMQLVLRTEVGSSFSAKVYAKSPDTSATGRPFDTNTQYDDALWWEFDALVTNSSVSFAPGTLVAGVIDFVTTGPIRLRAQTQATRYLLQQSGDKIELEQDTSSYILLEEPE
jgi:hypothetical protein